jgi:hypothetical protein
LQKETFGTVALPLYVILDAQGNKISVFSGMTRNAAEFERFLNVPFTNPRMDNSAADLK